MDGRVIELDALTDTDRAGTEYDDLLFIRQTAVVLPGVGGVQIRDVFAGMQGIDHAEDRYDAVLLSLFVDLDLVTVPQLRDVRIGEAHFLGCFEYIQAVDLGLEAVLHSNDLTDRFEEQRRHHRDLMQLFDRHAASHRLCDREEVVVAECLEVFEDVLCGHVIELGHVQVVHTDLERTNRLEDAFLEIAADAHDLAGRLHLGAERIGRIRELVEREARAVTRAIG